jgi:hypothetical protein
MLLKKQPTLGLGFVRIATSWRGDRVVEGAALEKQCAGNRTEGSNPSLSARKIMQFFQEFKGYKRGRSILLNALLPYVHD